MQVLAMILALIFFIVGLAGSILPIIPGAILMWVGMLIYGLMTDFATLGLAFFIGQALAVTLAYIIDYLSGAYGAKRYGGSRYAIYGSIIGAIVGLILMGPAGIIFGPFLGAIIGELINQKPLETAFKTGVGTLIGLLSGTVIKLAIQIIMIIWFFWAVYR